MKKVHLLAFATCLFFAACNDGTKTADTTPNDTTANSGKMTQEDKEERNKKIAMESVDAMNAHNVDQALSYATPDAVDYGDGSMEPVKNMDSVKNMIKGFIAAFPDYKGSDLVATADGDRVMVYGVWTGTFKNDYMGMKATGKSFKVNDVDIFTFNDDGKITSHRNIMPWMVSMQQVGAKMPK
jgi:predicted ester cyclase